MVSFKWQKMGRVFNPAEIQNKYFLKEFSQAPSTIVFDDFVRVYFSCRPTPDSSGQYVSYSAFIDLDRNNLFKVLKVSEKPILELGGLGTFDEFGTYPVSVIRQGNLFMAFYAGWTRCESVPYNTSIGLATSNDNGETFQKYGKGPILSFSLLEPMTISGPKIRFFNGQYYLFYVAGIRWINGIEKPESVFKIRMAKSVDGINWERHNTNLLPDFLNENECQASPDVFYKNGRFHMFFSYKHAFDFRNKERGYRIGYAFSDNLVNWTRFDALAGLDVSETGWDAEMVSYPHIFELNNRINMFYLGNSVGRNGFGWAVLENNPF
jgi:predicted GH43/DUF377 family glycosyl hydrolase